MSQSGVRRRAFLQCAAEVSGAVLLGCARRQPEEPARETGAIYLADMSRFEPRSALSRKPMRHHWRLLDFESDVAKGVMLVAGQNTGAPEINLPFEQKGWHRIYFGIRSFGAGEDETKLLVRMDDRNVFTTIRHKQGAPDRIDEYYWRTADLTGRRLHLRPFRLQLDPDNADSIANPSSGVWLAYIKLVPVSGPEASDARTRTLYAHHDAWSYMFWERPTTAEDIERQLEVFRDTDFSRVYWESAQGDRTNYFSKLGVSTADDGIQDFYRVGDRLAAESMRILRKNGIDPLRVAADYLHGMGLECHATFRPSGFHFDYPLDEWNLGGLYEKHPEWRGTDREGNRTPRLSYAYPEMRKAVLEILKETARYPVEGICVAYNRRPPFLEYDTPIIESFQSRYGTDPRKLDERDSQWLSHRATFMTQWMRELRQALDEVGRERGVAKPLEISAIVMGTEAENLYYGLDLPAWIRERLVDTIIPYTSGTGLDSSKQSWVNASEAEFFLRISLGTRTKLACNLMPRQLSPDVYRERALGLYNTGVQHLFFWDCDARADFSPSWTILSRLGHREELEQWARAGRPKYREPASRLRKFGDWDLRYQTPG